VPTQFLGQSRGFTALEQTIMDSGAPDRVVDMRHDFQRVMAKRYTETIEALTERKVLAFLSQAHASRTSRWRSSSSTDRSRGSARSRSSNPSSAWSGGRTSRVNDRACMARHRGDLEVVAQLLALAEVLELLQ
jgi:hypothetical protein